MRTVFRCTVESDTLTNMRRPGNLPMDELKSIAQDAADPYRKWCDRGVIETELRTATELHPAPVVAFLVCNLREVVLLHTRYFLGSLPC